MKFSPRHFPERPRLRATLIAICKKKNCTVKQLLQDEHYLFPSKRLRLQAERMCWESKKYVLGCNSKKER
jgi:hypothetical protein